MFPISSRLPACLPARPPVRRRRRPRGWMEGGGCCVVVRGGIWRRDQFLHTLAFNLARARAKTEKDAGHRLTAAVWAGPMEGKEANQPVGLSLTCSRRGGPLGDKSDIRVCLVSPDLRGPRGAGGRGSLRGATAALTAKRHLSVLVLAPLGARRPSYAGRA